MAQKKLKDVNAGDYVNGKKVIFNERISMFTRTENRLEFDDRSIYRGDENTKVWVDDNDVLSSVRRIVNG